MTTFAYTALEPTGKKKTGFVDAASREAAIASISSEGRSVLEIKEHQNSAIKIAAASTKKIPKGELALFTRRLADLAEAGLPLDRVLQVVSEQSESPQLKQVAEEALEEVRKGTPVSDALAMHPKLFPQIFTQTLRAGEASGQFPQVASRLADFQEMEVTRRSQIISALIYPMVLTITAVMVVVFLVTFVMPRLSEVFKGLGSDLPLTTKMLLGGTDFISHNGLLILGSIVGLIIAYRAWSRTESGALSRDRLYFRMPLLGPVVRKATVSRFSRVLGTLVFGGVPILEALRLAGLATGNRVFQTSATLVESEVREGRPIADAMRDAGDFPPVLTHMVAIGEETGDLPKMLGRVADSLDFEVDNGMRRLTSLVEPIIVLVMGGFVGFVVLSVMLPIFNAQSAVK